jgi:hypothetical protein
VNSVPDWQPIDPLSANLGFNLHIQYQILITPLEVSSEVARMVKQHDNPETQELLLSIGSPTIDGYRYPAEDILGMMLKEHPIQQIEAHHLERVTAQIWATGELIDIPVVRPT